MFEDPKIEEGYSEEVVAVKQKRGGVRAGERSARSRPLDVRI